MTGNFRVVEIGQEYLDWATKLRQGRRPDAGAVTHGDVGQYAVQCPDGTIVADGYFDRDAAEACVGYLKSDDGLLFADNFADRLAQERDDEWFDVTGFTRAEVIECIYAGCHKIYAGYVGGRAPDLHCWMAAIGQQIGDLTIDRVEVDADTGIVKMWISGEISEVEF